MATAQAALVSMQSDVSARFGPRPHLLVAVTLQLGVGACAAPAGAPAAQMPSVAPPVALCPSVLSDHRDVMEPEPLADADCDTVPDVEDACPEEPGVPQPLASRAGCPLDVEQR